MLRPTNSLISCLHWAVAAAAAAIFAGWFSVRQMQAVSAAFAANAPVWEYAGTAITVALFVFSLYVAALMTVRSATAHAPLLRAGALLLGVLIAIFVAPVWGMIALVLLVVVFSVVELLARRAKESVTSLILDHVAPLLVIGAVFTVVLVSVSPLYLFHSATRAAETYLASSSLAIRNFIGAYSFSMGTYTPTYWGAIEDVPTGLTSFVLAILGFLDIFTIWEATSFFKALVLINFAGYVLAAYFFYHFLRELAVVRLVALAAALLLYAGNQFYLNMVSQDMGWAGCSVMALSAGLWLLMKAFRQDSLVIGAGSGLIFASQFYFLAPHPEMTIYVVAIYIVAALAHVAGRSLAEGSRLGGLMICVVSGAAFTLASIGYLLPIVGQVLRRTMIVTGEDTVVLQSFAFKIHAIEFYVGVLALGLLFEFWRAAKFGRPRAVVVGFVLVGLAILPLAIAGVPTKVRALAHLIGWTMHLRPIDRILSYLGLAMLVVATIGLDAAIKLLHGSTFGLRYWNWLRSPGGWARRAFASNILPAVGAISLLLAVPWVVSSNPQVAVVDPSERPVYETLQAFLANSLPPDDQRASRSYLRKRLVEFEAQPSTARAMYDAELKALGATSVRDVSDEGLRAFAYRVAQMIDAAALADKTLDDIPDNIDGYLANLPNPYMRTMAIVGDKLQAIFLSAGRNIVNAHNTSEMFDSRVYVGFPTIQAFFLYPLDFLPNYRPFAGQHDYYIAAARPPWWYESEDIVSNDFRRLLGIAGVGAYLMLPDKLVLDAIADPATRLKRLSAEGPTQDRFVLVQDENAYDIAYLARVIGYVKSGEVEVVEQATQKFYTQKLKLEPYEEILKPFVARLLALPKKHDAIITLKPGENAPREPALAEGPSARGGAVTVDGIIGPRIGLKVSCPDAQCTTVYTLADLPGWRAYVDGRRVQISRANYAFIAVNVPQGEHYLSLFYETPWQGGGEWFSLAGVVAILILSWHLRIAKAPQRPYKAGL